MSNSRNESDCLPPTRRVRRKVAVSAAVLAMAGVGLVGVVPSYASDTATATSSSLESATLGIRVTDHSITAGGSFKVIGKLVHGSTELSGAKIILERRSSGSSTWYQVATKTTNSYGKVTFSVTQSSSGTYYYKLVHKAGTKYAYAVSAHERIHVSS
jgi:hypothetical protein